MHVFKQKLKRGGGVVMKKVLGLLIALGLMVSPVFAAGEQAAGDKAAAPAAGEKKPAKKAKKAKKAVKKEEKKEEMKQEQKQQ
jgi:hypothetical protein